MKAGIETASNADLLALGVAVGEHEGLVVALDPSTFVVTATSHPKTSDALHRVVPLLPSGSDLGSFLESSHRHATIESAYPVASDPPFVVGVARGNLVWAASRTSNPSPSGRSTQTSPSRLCGRSCSRTMLATRSHFGRGFAPPWRARR